MAALATAAAVWLFAVLATPIAKPLAWALIIGIATLPHHDQLARKFPNRPNLTAGLMVFAIAVCFIVPIAAMIIMVAENATDWYNELEGLILALTTVGPGTLSDFPLASEIFSLGANFGIDLSGVGARMAAGISGYLLELTTNAAKNMGGLFFTLSVALFILFFIYRDGKRIVFTAIARFATNQNKAHRYFSEIRAVTTAVTVGTIFTCLIQGVIAGLGYFVAGVPAPILCGALTALAALIPVVGTAIIWGPIVAILAINGAYLTALLLALWSIFFVSLADNAIRPLAIDAKSDIPVPAIVLGAIAGVFALGILGLILGPVIFSILITLWRDVTGVDQSEHGDDAGEGEQKEVKSES